MALTSIHGRRRSLLQICWETLVRLAKTESALVRSIERDPLLAKRVEHLMSISAVGPIMALTRALEVCDVQRFSPIKKAISYCGCVVQTGDQQSRFSALHSRSNGTSIYSVC